MMYDVLMSLDPLIFYWSGLEDVLFIGIFEEVNMLV